MLVENIVDQLQFDLLNNFTPAPSRRISPSVTLAPGTDSASLAPNSLPASLLHQDSRDHDDDAVSSPVLSPDNFPSDLANTGAPQQCRTCIHERDEDMAALRD